MGRGELVRERVREGAAEMEGARGREEAAGVGERGWEMRIRERED